MTAAATAGDSSHCHCVAEAPAAGVPSSDAAAVTASHTAAETCAGLPPRMRTTAAGSSKAATARNVLRSVLLMPAACGSDDGSRCGSKA